MPGAAQHGPTATTQTRGRTTPIAAAQTAVPPQTESAAPTVTAPARGREPDQAAIPRPTSEPPATADSWDGNPEGLGGLVEQDIRAYVVTPGRPSIIPLDAEGGELVAARILVAEGADIKVKIEDATGETPAGTSIGEQEVWGVPVVLAVSRAPRGSERHLVVTARHRASISVSTLVESQGVWLTTSTRPGGVGTAVIEAKVVGVRPGAADKYKVTALVSPPAGMQVRLSLHDDGVEGDQMKGDLVYTARVRVPASTSIPVDVWLRGPHTRSATTDALIPAGGAKLGAITSDRLVDTDRDGVTDALRIGVGVRVERAGDHNLNITLAGQEGFSSGQATLRAGKGVVYVDVPIEAVLALDHDGPYTIARATLIRYINDGRDTEWLVKDQPVGGRTKQYRLRDQRETSGARARESAT